MWAWRELLTHGWEGQGQVPHSWPASTLPLLEDRFFPKTSALWRMTQLLRIIMFLKSYAFLVLFEWQEERKYIFSSRVAESLGCKTADSIKKHLLSIYYFPGAVLGAQGNTKTSYGEPEGGIIKYYMVMTSLQSRNLSGLRQSNTMWSSRAWFGARFLSLGTDIWDLRI